ncbi:MAG: hypothetical protein K0S08_31 [Gammaproteobacteria bacterium]|jgi:hypothetical protein|nr:hypothetical protein [Gammaproteobacteria bacterium]
MPASIITIQNLQDEIELSVKQADSVYATAKIIAGDNRIMVSNFSQAESTEAKEAIKTFMQKLYQEFGGKICILNPPAWVKQVLADEGFVCESKGMAGNLRRTDIKVMQEGIQQAVITEGFGGDDETINTSLIGEKMTDSFGAFDEKFKVLRGQDVASRAQDIALLAKESNFAPALIERCLAAGARGFQTPNAIAIESKETRELVAYVCIDGHGEYGYFGNTFVNKNKFFGGGRQAGTAYLYSKALETIFADYPHLMVIAPPKRDKEFDLNFNCQPLSPAQGDIMVKFDHPIGLENRLAPPYAPKDTRFHHLLFENKFEEMPLENYLERLKLRLGGELQVSEAAAPTLPKPL